MEYIDIFRIWIKNDLFTFILVLQVVTCPALYNNFVRPIGLLHPLIFTYYVSDASGVQLVFQKEITHS